MGSAHIFRTCAARLCPSRWRNLVPMALLLLLAACASAPHRREPTFIPSRSALANEPARAPKGKVAVANNVLFHALALVGTPYRWGGDTPATGFDCSGLVDYIYRYGADILLPHNARELSRLHGRKIRRMRNLVSGDLVFFDIDGGISHVGVYVGKGRFVDAPDTGGTVRLDDIDGPYWSEHFAYGKRLLD